MTEVGARGWRVRKSAKGSLPLPWTLPTNTSTAVRAQLDGGKAVA